MSQRNQRNRKADEGRLNPFGEKTNLEQMSDDIFGASTPPEFNTGRVVARPIPLADIWPDLCQPRRVIPASIRLVSNGSPADVPQLLQTWAAVAANAAGRTINIQQIIMGEGEGLDTDNTPPIYESFIDLLRLAGSILRDGLINPINIISRGDNYIIESGERRWLASWLLHLHMPDADAHARIPAVITSGVDYVWRQAAENTARRSLNAVGMARQLALLIMAARGQDQYADYEQIVPPGGSDRRYYAQIADGNVHRIPKGTGERIQTAMGLAKDMISNYRNILRITEDEEINDIIWLRGDIEDWPERAFRDVNRLTAVNLRQIISRDSWSLDDFRADTLTTVKVQPSTPPPTPHRLTGEEDAEARLILADLRAGFDRAYEVELNGSDAARAAADRATRFLNQAQGHYDNNRLNSARELIDNAIFILDQAEKAPPPSPLDTPKVHPKPNTHDPYMHRIYDAWRKKYEVTDLVLITQDGDEYFALANDDAKLRRQDMFPQARAGGIGLSGSADYMLVTRIRSDLFAEVVGRYQHNVIAVSYDDLDEDMQYVAGVAIRSRSLPLNTLPTPQQPQGRTEGVVWNDGRPVTADEFETLKHAPASDKSASDASQHIVERDQPIFTILTGILDLAQDTGHPQAASAAELLLQMTWAQTRQAAASSELDDIFQVALDQINIALGDWSEKLIVLLNNVHQGSIE